MYNTVKKNRYTFVPTQEEISSTSKKLKVGLGQHNLDIQNQLKKRFQISIILPKAQEACQYGVLRPKRFAKMTSQGPRYLLK
jgi:hypothetical protein